MTYSAYDETHLPTATRIGSRRSYSRMSWGSVLAGAVVAGASMILLSLLGVALGAGGLLTQATASDMAGYGLGAGIWSAVNLILSMGFGAYVAARLSGTHSHLDAELHGITVWAVAILLVTVLLAQAVGAILGTVASTAGTAAGSAVSTATTSLAGGVTQQIGPQNLVNQLEQSLSSSGDPTQMTRAQITSEIATLAGRRVVNGSLTDQERDRLTTLVAAQAGVSKEEAARRVTRMEQDAVAALAQTEQQARKVAAAAAHGAAAGAKALFSGLLLSLAGAMVGAWLGTRHARLLTPIQEHEYDSHTTTTVTHHAYDPVAATHYTAYEPVAVAPTSVRVHPDEPTATGAVPSYLRGVSFPATKQDLLRLARASNDEPGVLRRLEQVADRSYNSLQDLMSALGTA